MKVFENPSQNAKSKKGGLLPVAILGVESFDVTEIDVSSLLLEGVAPLRHNLEDVAAPVVNGEECECTTAGPDGIMDLALKFRKQDVAMALGFVTDGDVLALTLTGTLLDGTPFEASDCIIVRGPRIEPEIAAITVDSEPGLIGAYPNPFNPTTQISFRLPREDFVKLSVYDVTGILVDRVVSGIQSAGEHVVEWNATSLPSGIYFYRLEVGNFSETRKMILLK